MRERRIGKVSGKFSPVEISGNFPSLAGGFEASYRETSLNGVALCASFR
jgi:hypothetical protein